MPALEKEAATYKRRRHRAKTQGQSLELKMVLVKSQQENEDIGHTTTRKYTLPITSELRREPRASDETAALADTLPLASEALSRGPSQPMLRIQIYNNYGCGFKPLPSWSFVTQQKQGLFPPFTTSQTFFCLLHSTISWQALCLLVIFFLLHSLWIHLLFYSPGLRKQQPLHCGHEINDRMSIYDP